jgi:hypothetical protein
MEDKEYKVGDKIWFIPGYRGQYLLAIQCTITEVDDHFRKQEPQAHLFYDIDEPCGHFLAADEIIDSYEEAQEILKEFFLEEYENNSDANPNLQLSAYREKAINFILGTQRLNLLDHENSKKEWLDSLPDKEYGVEWFNYSFVENRS